MVKNKEKGKSRFSTFTTILLIFSTILCFVVVIQSAISKQVSFMGYRFFYVATGSMEPTIATGSLVLSKEENNYELNDVVTFYSKDKAIYGKPNTHRIVAISEENNQQQFMTKGDANNTADGDLITKEDIIGKVVVNFGKMKFVGTILGFLTTRMGFFFIVLVPILAITISSMRDFVKEYKKELARVAKEINEKEHNEDK